MNVLESILKERLATRDTSAPLAVLKSFAAELPPPRDFTSALRSSHRISVIAEIKFRSPSSGVLRADDDVEFIAQSYANSGASALSILTERHSFGGSLRNLVRAKQTCGLPVLRKDFLYDEYDIWESRAHNADAILLIAKMLSTAQLHDLCEAAHEANLAVLLELHDEEDLRKADRISNVAWGVNHRNLETLDIDLSVSEHLFPLLPTGELRVAESGLAIADNLRLMHDRGADAVLIGTSLMKQADPGRALAKLLT